MDDKDLDQACQEIIDDMEDAKLKELMAEAWLTEHGVPRYVIEYLKNV